MYTCLGDFMTEKVVGIGMSGGVDSSVAAYLLKEDNYKVIGITMRLIDDQKTNESIKDAKAVCDTLGIDHYVVDLREKFKKYVINDFINNYKMGNTPNPCVVCNKYFKFGLFYEEAKKLGCDYIATGHYAKVKDGKLYRADVLEKDQSYFLYSINRDILDKIIFPLAHFNDKSEVREIAKKAGLTVESKKDSQEVCFVPNDDYRAFLRTNMDDMPQSGNICLETGEILGKHNGLINYTIGQRKGLNISYKEPLYVIKIDVTTNSVIVGPNSSLYRSELIATNVNLLTDCFENACYAKVRSRGQLEPCMVELSDDSVFVRFERPQRAITLGQSVVFYNKDDQVLGGGIISTVR